MLIVAPTGRTKRVTLLSMPRLSSKHRNVTGKVPALQQTKKQAKKQQEEILYYDSNVCYVVRFSLQTLDPIWD